MMRPAISVGGNKVATLFTNFVKYTYLKRIKKASDNEIGRWAKERICEQGVGFIKLGQFASTRTDIFGKDITDELKQLQDNVPPFDFRLLDVILAEFKDDFEFIEPIPLASASIGQVHRATLKDGTNVVIKARRPGIEAEIIEDCELLLNFLDVLKRFSRDRKIIEFDILFKEYYKLLKEEIDFKQETKNMRNFRKLFVSTSYVKIPKVYKKLSNNDIITMEYLPCIKIDDCDKISDAKLNRKLIAQKLIELYIMQIIEFGLVHIDPHGGNLGITKEGKIVFYDFGAVIYLDSSIKDNFQAFLTAVFNKDIDLIVQIAVDIELFIVEEKNIPYLKRFLISFLSYIDNLDLDEFKTSYIDKVNKTNMPFLISSKFLLLLRGLSILEGNCKSLDPDFTYLNVVTPYINEAIIDIDSWEARARRDITNIQSAPDKIRALQIQNEILERNLLDVEQKFESETGKRAITIGVLGLSLVLHSYFQQEVLASILLMSSLYMINK